MKAIFLTLVLMLSFLSSVPAQVIERVDVRLEQQKTINSGRLKIKFVKVMEDSRCPINARCVWAGNAKVRISVSGRSSGWRNFDLNTSGRDVRQVTYDGYDILLEDLNPGRGGTGKPTVTLSVEKHK